MVGASHRALRSKTGRQVAPPTVRTVGRQAASASGDGIGRINGQSQPVAAVIPTLLLRYVAVNANPLGSRPTILIAEDDPDTLAMLEDLLVDEGYDVVTADDGREALRLANSRPVDLILLDHTMPHLSGVAFCTAYREHGGQAPVVLISAASEPAIADTVSACGAAGYIPKPFVIDDVLTRIAPHVPPPTPPPHPSADGARG